MSVLDPLASPFTSVPVTCIPEPRRMQPTSIIFRWLRAPARFL